MDNTVDYTKVEKMRAILADPVRRAAYLSGERIDLLVEKLVKLWADEDEGSGEWTPLDDE